MAKLNRSRYPLKKLNLYIFDGEYFQVNIHFGKKYIYLFIEPQTKPIKLIKTNAIVTDLYKISILDTEKNKDEILKIWNNLIHLHNGTLHSRIKARNEFFN